MDPISILEQWVSPVTDPLKEFQAQLESLSSIHQSSVNNYQSLINDLADSGDFTGDAAEAAVACAEEYIRELAISSAVVETGPIAVATSASTTAAADIADAVLNAAGEVTDTGPLLDIVEVVDVTTIAQAGADVPEDVAAAGITLAEGAALLLIFIQFVGTLFLIWQMWDSIMNAAATQGYPPLPHDPSPIVPSSKTTADPKNLSVEERDRLQHIKQALGGTQFSTKEIIDLMREGYTDEEIIAMLRARSYLAKDNNKDDKFTYDNDYLKALAKKGLDATYLQKR